MKYWEYALAGWKQHCLNENKLKEFEQQLPEKYRQEFKQQFHALEAIIYNQCGCSNAVHDGPHTEHKNMNSHEFLSWFNHLNFETYLIIPSHRLAKALKQRYQYLKQNIEENCTSQVHLIIKSFRLVGNYSDVPGSDHECYSLNCYQVNAKGMHVYFTEMKHNQAEANELDNDSGLYD